jgi:hypothetical protein
MTMAFENLDASPKDGNIAPTHNHDDDERFRH